LDAGFEVAAVSISVIWAAIALVGSRLVVSAVIWPTLGSGLVSVRLIVVSRIIVGPRCRLVLAAIGVGIGIRRCRQRRVRRRFLGLVLVRRVGVVCVVRIIRRRLLLIVWGRLRGIRRVLLILLFFAAGLHRRSEQGHACQKHNGWESSCHSRFLWRGVNDGRTSGRMSRQNACVVP